MGSLMLCYLEALKSLLIIERTPEPSVTPEPDEPINIDELSASQKAKLDKFLEGLTVYIPVYRLDYAEPDISTGKKGFETR